jgi:transcription elongation factor SPT5
MHDGMVADEVWRPGVLDQDDANPDSPTNGGGWGADNSTVNDFGSTANDDGGWGSSNQTSGSVWAPETTENIETSQPTPGINHRDQLGNAMEAHVAENEETAVWYMERVCVQLKSDDKPAVIKEVHADKTAIVELEDHSTRTVRFSDVSRIEPKEKDTVLVIGGADVGVEGELVCIDGSDAILKDGNEDFKIVDFVHLAKVSSD